MTLLGDTSLQRSSEVIESELGHEGGPSPGRARVLCKEEIWGRTPIYEDAKGAIGQPRRGAWDRASATAAEGADRRTCGRNSEAGSAV